MACAFASAGSRAQTITATPEFLVFSGYVGGPNPQAQMVRIAKAGAGALTWQVRGQQRPWLTLTSRSGTAPDSLGFAANIAGMHAGVYGDTVYVVSSGAATPSQAIPVRLYLRDRSFFGPPAAAGTLATYQVEFAFIGYTGLVEGAPDCKVNLHGFDRLVGTMTGVETPASDEDVVYYGFLRRDTAIDFCETRGKKAPGDDERVWCAVTLAGWAAASVELTVHSDSASGAWLKADTVTAPMERSVHGDCDPQETSDILTAYPMGDDGGGASPNGQQIDDTRATDANNRRVTFVSGGVPRLRVGTYPSDSPHGGWTLRVIRKVP